MPFQLYRSSTWPSAPAGTTTDTNSSGGTGPFVASAKTALCSRRLPGSAASAAAHASPPSPAAKASFARAVSSRPKPSGTRAGFALTESPSGSSATESSAVNGVKLWLPPHALSSSDTTSTSAPKRMGVDIDKGMRGKSSK